MTAAAATGSYILWVSIYERLRYRRRGYNDDSCRRHDREPYYYTIIGIYI